ncbi:unnamed protein product [marine sediment metagenome]|uniref:Uncharacterized protein n=1 Tax=marine sediment metagenome TaxID=412755 RepID=X1DY34_9ZZZZ
MVDEEILTFHEITGKGGHRRIYAPKYDEAGSKLFWAKKILKKLSDTWPDATQSAIDSLNA